MTPGFDDSPWVFVLEHSTQVRAERARNTMAGNKGDEDSLRWTQRSKGKQRRLTDEAAADLKSNKHTHTHTHTPLKVPLGRVGPHTGQLLIAAVEISMN